jgi:hypothetical protein
VNSRSEKSDAERAPARIPHPGTMRRVPASV